MISSDTFTSLGTANDSPENTVLTLKRIRIRGYADPTLLEATN